MKRIFTTTLRLDMTDEEDRLAWSHLQRMDKKQYRSYSKAIVAAVNDYFGRQEQLAADPYLETREKEDAFLQRIENTICNALRFAPVPMAAVQPSAPVQTEPTVPLRVPGIFTGTTISPSSRLRQCPDRYTIRSINLK